MMMSDHSKLKALALACPQEPWAYEPHGDTDTYGVGVMWDGNDQLVTGYQKCGEMLVVESIAPEVNGSNYAAFIAAASPAVVLELLSALEEKDQQIADAEVKG
ncbi:MAG: ead/Ea22-like family protein, partial [Chania sp.]